MIYERKFWTWGYENNRKPTIDEVLKEGLDKELQTIEEIMEGIQKDLSKEYPPYEFFQKRLLEITYAANRCREGIKDYENIRKEIPF